VIATQPKDHPKMIMDAAHAGKHIFSEKPLGYAKERMVRCAMWLTRWGGCCGLFGMFSGAGHGP